MNAVTGVGAPWYTSGVHMWNGTAATLNANPTSRKTTASSPIAWLPGPPSASAILPMFVVPVAPYAIAMPYRKNAEENAPSRKYFIDASPATARDENPVST